MMSTQEQTWSGPADLLDANGRIVAEVAATLWKRTADGRGVQWGGRVTRPPSPEHHLPTAEADYTLRLRAAGEHAPEATVTPHGIVRMALSATPCVEYVEITGNGEAPF